MRDPKRIKEVCDELADIWEKNVPDWRFCQLIDNFFAYYNSDCFYLEDNKFIEKLKEYFTE